MRYSPAWRSSRASLKKEMAKICFSVSKSIFKRFHLPDVQLLQFSGVRFALHDVLNVATSLHQHPNHAWQQALLQVGCGRTGLLPRAVGVLKTRIKKIEQLRKNKNLKV